MFLYIDASVEPSKPTDVHFIPINETTAKLVWKPPQFQRGEFQKYVVSTFIGDSKHMDENRLIPEHYVPLYTQPGQIYFRVIAVTYPNEDGCGGGMSKYSDKSKWFNLFHVSLLIDF